MGKGLRVAMLGDESPEWQPFLGVSGHKELAAAPGVLEGFALRIGLFALLWNRLRLRTLGARALGNKISVKPVTKVSEILQSPNHRPVLAS